VILCRKYCDNGGNADLIQLRKEVMKKTYLIMTLALILSPAVSAGRYRPLANEGKAGLYLKSIEQVLRLDEDEVDLGTAALIISENWSDLVYGRVHLATLDDMAMEIRNRVERDGVGMNYQAIAVMNDYLFNELGFEAIPKATEPNDLFLHTVLDEKKGYCLSLSILYLSLGERLGLPLHGVVVPGHFFVRYDDNRVRLNIETTGKGGTNTDEYYIKDFKVPKGELEDDNEGIYMKNLDKIQTLGCFFNNLGIAYDKVGNKDMAQLALKRAVEINPGLSEARINLADIYLIKGQVKDAIYEYQAALDINPNHAMGHNNLGNAYAQRGWPSKAISQYKQALALDPNLIDAYKNLAITYGNQKRFMLAKTQLKKALRLKPKDASLYNLMGYIYNRMDDCQQAIIQYQKAIDIKPDSAEACFGLAFCCNKLGLVDDEIQAYERALAIKPDMLEALINLGNAYFGKQNYDAAIELFEKAVQIKPEKSAIHYNLGSAYSNKEMYEQAVAAYLKAVELEPKMGDAHFGLALGYYNTGKFDLAYEHIKIAQELGVKVTEEQINAVKSHLK